MTEFLPVILPLAWAAILAIAVFLYVLLGGYDLGRDYPHLKDHMLVAVTEVNTRDNIDRLVLGLQEAAR